MTTTAPPVDGRVIGLAHYASRAVLEGVLSRHGLSFQQSVALRLVAVAGGPVDRVRLAGDVAGALKTGRPEADGVVGGLITAGLLAPDGPSPVRITDAGRALHETVSAETEVIAARIYAGIPSDELAAAGRVLALVTERADRELAAVAASPDQ
ncbi:MarR family winged helix-turn-helix transcriptional regulator [Streptomyces prasinopilosus]|uniref:MarR family winged helix-turn-helix transcriptional regulator n=1 Tax=Streptomyces prasinopilosus TaxID=67344 RepID=UPI0006EBA227|nr:MarR family winged helix-turn-helix transcriptional regulator [Streptomyces prasinopilosus]